MPRAAAPLRAAALLLLGLASPAPAPPAPAAPYRLLWNSPWPSACDAGTAGPPVDWDGIGVEANAGGAFNGEAVATLYKTGLWPRILGNGTLQNGGLPQSPDFDLQAHLSALTADIEQAIPDEKFSGVATLDFEAWAPQWNWHGPPHLAAGDAYWNASVKLAGGDAAKAKAAWLDGVQEVTVRTIQHAQKLRPLGTWGYYDFVLPPDDCVAGAAEGTASGNPCSQGNDELPRLWEAVGAIMPSIYFLQNSSADAMRGGVDSKVGEATRLAAAAAKRTGKAPASVIPFSCPTYVYAHLPGQSGMTSWLTAAQAAAEFARPAAWGAAGTVIWASSEDTYSKDLCAEGRKAFDSTLAPLLKTISVQTAACANTVSSQCCRQPLRPFQRVPAFVVADRLAAATAGARRFPKGPGPRRSAACARRAGRARTARRRIMLHENEVSVGGCHGGPHHAHSSSL